MKGRRSYSSETTSTIWSALNARVRDTLRGESINYCHQISGSFIHFILFAASHETTRGRREKQTRITVQRFVVPLTY